MIAVIRALVLRPLLREKGRAALTVVGISVGIAVLVAIQLANRSALRAFGESIDAVAGKANWQIVAEGGSLDETLLLRLQPFWEEGVRFAPVIDLEGIFTATGVPIRILGVDLFSDLHFRDYRYARVTTQPGETRADERREVAAWFDLFRRDSVVLPESFARDHRLDLGSRVVVEAAGERAPLVVRGILRPTGPATAFNGSIAVVDIATAQTQFGLEGRLTRVDLLVPENGMERTIAAIGRVLPPNALVEKPSRRNQRVDEMLRAFRVNLFALAAVSLLVGIFLVYNTVLVSILRRRRDIGIVKTLGAAPRQILAAFLFEGALFGLAGSVVGVALGTLLAWSALGLIGQTINSLYLATAPERIDLTPGVVAFAIVTGLVVSIASAVQPAMEAATTRPNVLIRPGLYQRVTPTRGARLAIAAAGFFLLAAFLATLPPVGGIAVAGYAAVVGVVAGFSLLAPLTLHAIAKAIGPLLARLAPVSGRLGSASVIAALRRLSIATAALSIAIGMMVAVTVMVGSFRETVQAWADQTIQSDLWLRPARGFAGGTAAAFPPEIARDLRLFPFIEAFDRFRGRDIIYRDAIVALGSGDLDVAAEHANLPMITPRDSRSTLLRAHREGGVIVSEVFAAKFGVRRGEVIELPTAAGVARLPVVGIYRDYSTDRGVVIMSRRLFVELYRDEAINTISLFLKPGTDIDFARREIERSLGKKYRVFTITNRAIRTEVMRVFDQTFLVTWALLIVSVVVAVLGIINTLSAFILERRHEIGLLRIIGTSRAKVSGMLIVESLIIGIASTILGAASGFVLAAILIFVINRQSFGWTIEFDPPAGLVALALAATFAATILAALVPSRLSAKIRPAEALKSE